MITPPRTAIRRLSIGRAVSMSGSEAAWIGLMVAIFNATGSTVWMSAALFVTVGASGVFTPLAGALGDRYDRRTVMVGSDLLTAVVAALMVLAHAPLLLIGLAFAGAVAQSPYFASSTAAVPNLVERADVAWANSTLGLGRSAGSLIGPVLGGLLSAAAGPHSVFALTAACFACSGFLAWTVHGRFADTKRPGEHEHRGLRAGFRYLAGEPVLRLITLAWVVLLFLLGPVLVAELPLARSFGSGSVGYGLLVACWGAGGIVGSFAGRDTVRRSERWTMVAGTVLIGTGFGVVAAAPALVVALAGMALAGVAEGAVNVAEQGILQRRTPDAVRSRTTAASEALLLSAFALSFPAAGYMIRLIGVRGVYTVGAAGGLLAALVLVPAMRHATTDPQPQPEPAPS
jgi:MFS family permease